MVTAQRKGSYGIFDGDGREKVYPTIRLPATIPIAVTRGQARMLIDRFVQRGVSQHTGRASTLWVILEYVGTKRLSYTLTAVPMMGYIVEVAAVKD